MTDFLFFNSGYNTLIKTSIIAPSQGSNGTIMEIRETGTNKLAARLNKGIITSQKDMKALAQAVGCNLTQYTEGAGAAATVIV